VRHELGWVGLGHTVILHTVVVYTANDCLRIVGYYLWMVTSVKFTYLWSRNSLFCDATFGFDDDLVIVIAQCHLHQ